MAEKQKKKKQSTKPKETKPRVDKEEEAPEGHGHSSVVDIAVGDIDHWEMNPNEQDTASFNILLEKIKTNYDSPEEMDQALHVIKNPDEPGKYIVMSGNHRLKAVKYSGGKTVKCRIMDWDVKTATEEAISDNLIGGKLSQSKFTTLVNWYSKKFDVSMDEIPTKFGFVKETDFYKNYKKQKEKALEEVEKKAKEKAKGEIQRVENLSYILNKLFREYGETLDSQFMFFNWGSKLHLMVEMDEDMKEMMDQITDFTFDNKVDINSVLRALLKDGIEKIDSLTAHLKADKEK